MQVSRDPAQGYLLVAAVGMVIGLIASLGVRRRRVWVRLVPAPTGPAEGGSGRARTVIEVGGLARSDAGDFHGEFGETAATVGDIARPGHGGVRPPPPVQPKKAQTETAPRKTEQAKTSSKRQTGT